MKQLLLQKGKAGSTLVEVVVAIAILGLVTAPICSNMMVSARLNAKSRDMMAAQLQVSSAVEQLMAKGIEKDKAGGDISGYPGVSVTSVYTDGNSYSEVVITSEDGLVSVETIVKVNLPKETPPAGTGGTT